MDDDLDSKMQRRRITLPDGRYLIFYTYIETRPALVASDTTAARLASAAEAETEEEQHV
jgi:hypothetical protein